MTGNKMISEKIIDKTFVEVKSFITNFSTNQRLYDANEVDNFLVELTVDAQKLEGNAKTLYDFYQRNQKEKEKEKVKQSVEPIDPEKIPGRSEVVQNQLKQIADKTADAVKENKEPISKIQQQMVLFLEQAEEKSAQVLEEAQRESEEIIRSAKRQAKLLIEDAQDKAAEEKRRSEERLQEMQVAEIELQERAAEVYEEIKEKADEIRDYSTRLDRYSKNLREIVEKDDQKMA